MANLEEIEQQIGDLWIEVAKEFGFEYEVEDGVYRLLDHDEGLLKHFGSGTLGEPATFWFTKAQIEFEKRLSTLKIK